MTNILLLLIYPMAPVALPKGWIREAAEKTGARVEEKFAAFANALCARVWSEDGVKTGKQRRNVCTVTTFKYTDFQIYEQVF